MVIFIFAFHLSLVYTNYSANARLFCKKVVIFFTTLTKKRRGTISSVNAVSAALFVFFKDDFVWVIVDNVAEVLFVVHSLVEFLNRAFVVAVFA